MIKRILITIIIVLALVGCNQTSLLNNSVNDTEKNNKSANKTGNIQIIINNSENKLSLISPIGMRKILMKTINPNFNIDHYDLNGDGPNGATLSLTNISNGQIISDLVVGLWNITILGKDSLNNTIAIGTNSVNVTEGVTSSTTVDIKYYQNGQGNINILINWSNTINVTEVNLQIDSIDKGNIYSGGNSINYSEPNISSGSHEIVIKIKDGSKILAVLIEIVNVFDNLTTVWSKSLSNNEINSVPPIPSNFRFVEGNNKVLLYWNDNSDIETGYKIQRSPDGITYEHLVELPANTIGYEDSTAILNNNYYYRILAYNDFGSSEFTSSINAGYFAPTVLSITPASGSINVDVTTDIKIIFSEQIDKKSLDMGNVRYYNPIFTFISNTNSQYILTKTNVTDDTVIIKPNTPFPPNTTISSIEIQNFFDLAQIPVTYVNSLYNFTTKDIAPEFVDSTPGIKSINSSSIEFETKINEQGKIYFVVINQNEAEPTPAQVKQGKNSLGNFVSVNMRGTYNCDSYQYILYRVNGLLQDTDYKICFVAEDLNSNISKVFSLNFKTASRSDILVYEDFEDESVNSGPSTFIPSGEANPDWDNALLSTNGASPGSGTNVIKNISISGNNTNKYSLIKAGSQPSNLFLGLSFLPSDKNFLIVEYDVYIMGTPGSYPSFEFYATDSYEGLDTNNANIAMHLEFDDNMNISGDQANNRLYYRIGQPNNITYLQIGGTEEPADITWVTSQWYKVFIVFDQASKKIDIKLTFVNTGSSQIKTDIPYNNNNSGLIKKVWFGTSLNSIMFYLDNIVIYQSNTKPILSSPMIFFNSFTGPITNNNINIPVKFYGNGSNIDSIKYKIGDNNENWQNITKDGFDTNIGPVPLTSYSGPTYISNNDFTDILSQGENKIYFRIFYGTNYINSTLFYTINKDTKAPDILTITEPNSYIINSVPAVIKGTVCDKLSGMNFNTMKIVFKKGNLYWNQFTSSWDINSQEYIINNLSSGPNITLNWDFNSAIPPDINQDITIIVKAWDTLNNGPKETQFTYKVLNNGIPDIVINKNIIGPAKTNLDATIDVDFFDDIDLQNLLFKIDYFGDWRELRKSDNTIPDLSANNNTSSIIDLYIGDANFANLPDGEHKIYFKAIDNGSNIRETTTEVIFIKDTTNPEFINLIEPSINDNPFNNLLLVKGIASDNINGSGLQENSIKFSIKRNSDNKYWDAGIKNWVPVEKILPTIHKKSKGSETVIWTSNCSLPQASQLTAGNYTFRIYIKDLAGNEYIKDITKTYNLSPKISLITEPVKFFYTNSSFPQIKGIASDSFSGPGLDPDSTKISIKRSKDNYFWNKTTNSWVNYEVFLPTIHNGTVSDQIVNWQTNTSPSPLPNVGDLTDDTYEVYAKVTNKSMVYLFSSSVYVIFDKTRPVITSASLSPNNSYLKIDFSEKIWGNNTRSNAIDISKFNLIFNPNGSSLTINASNFYENPELTISLKPEKGYSTVYLKISNNGSATGVETIELKVLANSIFDQCGNEMAASETTGIITFFDKKNPDIDFKYPEHNSMVDMSVDLNIKFSENIIAVPDKYLTIKRFSNNSIFKKFLVTDTNYIKISGENVIVDPGPNNYFENNITYYIEIDNGAFKDNNNNEFLGIFGPATWRFTTIDKPPVQGADIYFTDIESTSVMVHWGLASDTLTPQNQLRYKLVKSTNESDIDSIVKINSISSTDEKCVFDWTFDISSTFCGDLLSATKYYFGLIVKDGNNNITMYNIKNVTTD